MVFDRRTKTWRSRLARATTGLAIGLFAGCSDSGLQLAKVSGVVTVDGEPMAYVGVIFHPELGPIATGNTDAEGRFNLVTSNESGALVGEHVVTISGATSGVSYAATDYGTVGAPVRNSSGRNPRARFSTHYALKSTSDLRVTVESGKKNEFVFELNKEGA